MNAVSFVKIGVAAVLILLCALHSASAEDRFTDNRNGTVTDHARKLMWAKTDNQGDIDWNQARRWVRYTFPYTLPRVYDDWRLPSLEELQSLYVRKENRDGYETECGQKVDIAAPFRLTCGWVWTSDTEAITARLFNFNRGVHSTDRMVKSRGYRALPVRSLEDD